MPICYRPFTPKDCWYARLHMCAVLDTGVRVADGKRTSPATQFWEESGISGFSGAHTERRPFHPIYKRTGVDRGDAYGIGERLASVLV